LAENADKAALAALPFFILPGCNFNLYYEH
jgi:hypothetical protein